MEEVQEKINKITENRCDNLDIGQYLDSPLVLVKANAILAVIRQKIIEKEILAKLDVISRNIRQEPRVWGEWTTGHYALVALKLLNSDESTHIFNANYHNLDEDSKRNINLLISQIKNDLYA